MIARIFALAVWVPLAFHTPTPAPSGTVMLRWTAVGDDGLTGRASEYDVRVSTDSITAGSFGAAWRVVAPAPRVSGTAESLLVLGLAPSTPHFAAVKSADEVPNWSAMSNVARTVASPAYRAIVRGPGTAVIASVHAVAGGPLLVPGPPGTLDTAWVSITTPTPTPGQQVLLEAQHSDGTWARVARWHVIAGARDTTYMLNESRALRPTSGVGVWTQAVEDSALATAESQSEVQLRLRGRICQLYGRYGMAGQLIPCPTGGKR